MTSHEGGEGGSFATSVGRTKTPKSSEPKDTGSKISKEPSQSHESDGVDPGPSTQQSLLKSNSSRPIKIWQQSTGGIKVRPYVDGWREHHKNPTGPCPHFKDGFRHCEGPMRCGGSMRWTPHPYEYKRFPNPDMRLGYSGTIEGGEWQGNREDRWKRSWLPVFQDPKVVAEITLDEVRYFLTNRFGSLKRAFDHLDFIKNGKLSCMEFTDGVYNIIQSEWNLNENNKKEIQELNSDGTKPPGIAFQHHIPRWMFNEKMKLLFGLMDIDNSGEISFKEFSDTRGDPVVSSQKFTRHRKIDLAQKKTVLDQLIEKEHDLKLMEGEIDDLDDNDIEKPLEDSDPAFHDTLINKKIRYFCSFLLARYESVEKAFKSFDLNKNGVVSVIEFVEGCRSVGFDGDAQEIFYLLDFDNDNIININEFISMVRPSVKRLRQTIKKLQESSEEKKRYGNLPEKYNNPIKPPGIMRRGYSLPGLDINMPMGENMATNANFYAFERHTTRRNNLEFHPNEIHGCDKYFFKRVRGPGSYQIPDDVGVPKHPSKKTLNKVGANSISDKRPRFQMEIPSVEGAEDIKNINNAHMNYPQYVPPKPSRCRLDQTGQVVNKVYRYRPPLKATEWKGLVKPHKTLTKIKSLNDLHSNLKSYMGKFEQNALSRSISHISLSK